jgi:hypothetical protein
MNNVTHFLLQHGLLENRNRTIAMAISANKSAGEQINHLVFGQAPAPHRLTIGDTGGSNTVGPSALIPLPLPLPPPKDPSGEAQAAAAGPSPSRGGSMPALAAAARYLEARQHGARQGVRRGVDERCASLQQRHHGTAA